MECMFRLEENEPVVLIIGKMGTTYSDRWGSCGGGGGATCVFLPNRTIETRGNVDARNLLLVAGGGGGAAAPLSSNGSDGAHASITLHGGDGLGPFHGHGGTASVKDGRRQGSAGTTRHIRTCFLDPKKEGGWRYMTEDKVKAVYKRPGKDAGYFPGAGSGIFESALAAAPGACVDRSALKGPPGVAAGGFGGGGCGDWHPEETRIEGSGIDSLFHCRAGNPIIRDQVLLLHGHVVGAEFQPQCILVDGGCLLAEFVDMACDEGNACVVKNAKRARKDKRPPGFLKMNECTVNDCRGNGLLVLEGGRLEVTSTRITKCYKDGVDVKGQGSTAEVSKSSIIRTGARHIICSKGADVTVSQCRMENSQSSGCVVMGQGSKLKMTKCIINSSMKNGVQVCEGGYCETRVCTISSNHDVGVIVLGIPDEDKMMYDETVARLIHCDIKKNAYGVWAQDGGRLTLLGGVVADSKNKDVTEHSQANMKTTNQLISLGSQIRVFFMTWQKEAKMAKVLHDRLSGLSNDELENEIQNVFREFDSDQSGEIEEAELGQALERLGVKLPESDIREKLKEIDENDDGVLSLAEFTLFFFTLVERKRNLVRPVLGEQAEAPRLSKKEAKQLSMKRQDAPKFRFPEQGCAIVIHDFLPELHRICAAHSSALDALADPERDAPLAFRGYAGGGGSQIPFVAPTWPEHPSDSEATKSRELFLGSLHESLQALFQEVDGAFSVSDYFQGASSLMNALDVADDDDVILLGPGQHMIPERLFIDVSIGICTASSLHRVVIEEEEPPRPGPLEILFKKWSIGGQWERKTQHGHEGKSVDLMEFMEMMKALKLIDRNGLGYIYVGKEKVHTDLAQKVRELFQQASRRARDHAPNASQDGLDWHGFESCCKKLCSLCCVSPAALVTEADYEACSPKREPKVEGGECEILCQMGEIAEVFCGGVIFAGIKLSNETKSASGCTINVRGGDTSLYCCSMVTTTGSAILCTVEEIDCIVTCSNCQFVNKGQGQLALVAKDGANANILRSELLGCSLYATHGGVINIDATQLVETASDSILVDLDGVVKACDSKIIGSLQNGITVEERGMLTLHRCAVIRSHHFGLVCSGACSQVFVNDSSIREGWCQGEENLHRCAVHVVEGASAEFSDSFIVINKGTGCVASGHGVRLRLVDSVISSNEHDGLRVEDGASADIWSLETDIKVAAALRQNGWCGLKASGRESRVKCSQVQIKANGHQLNKDGHGLVAEHGAQVNARFVDITSNTGAGILSAHEASVINMFSCNVSGNLTGMAAWTSARIKTVDCQVVRNMLNVHTQDGGSVEAGQEQVAARSLSQALPDIGDNAYPATSRGGSGARPATPLKRLTRPTTPKKSGRPVTPLRGERQDSSLAKNRVLPQIGNVGGVGGLTGGAVQLRPLDDPFEEWEEDDEEEQV